MADAIKVNVYKIGNSINTKLMGFPVISSEFSSTPSGQIRVGDTDCYGLIAFNGNQHYVKETVAELVTLANAGGGSGGSQDLESVLTEGNDAGGLTIDNLADPSTDQQAATKKYVDDNAGGLGYDVYVALLTQSSTDPIAATVLQNTMGTVTVSAFSTAEYILLETTIDYDPAKVFIAGFATAEGNGAVYVPIISGAVLAGYYSVNAYAEAGKLAFQVAFYTDAFAAASMSSLLTTNRFSMPEVRVYP